MEATKENIRMVVSGLHQVYGTKEALEECIKGIKQFNKCGKRCCECSVGNCANRIS